MSQALAPGQVQTRLDRTQLPVTTVYTDQANNFGSDQSFAAASSLRIKTGTGVPLAADCNTAIEVGRIYARSDASSASATLYVCANTGPGVFSWELGQGTGTGGTGTLTVKNNGTTVGTRPNLDFVPGTGIQITALDDGIDTVHVTTTADTAVLATVAGAQSFSGKKSFSGTANGAGLRVTPSVAPTNSLVSGDLYQDSTTNTPYYYNGANWKQFAVAAATLTSGSILAGNGANEVTTVTSTGTGDVVRAGAPTISNPIITSFVNSNHDHSDANSGGALAAGSYAAGAATLTNKVLDAEAAGNAVTLPFYQPYVAAICQATTASSGFSLPSANAAIMACVTGTNTKYGVLQFDATTAWSLQGRFDLPADWDATKAVDVLLKWRAAATTGNAIWAFRTVCVADGQTGDPAFSAANSVTDAAKGTANQWNDATISSVTMTGCSAGGTLLFNFFRDAANGSDTMTGNAELISLTLRYRRTM